MCTWKKFTLNYNTIIHLKHLNIFSIKIKIDLIYVILIALY